MRVRFVPGSCLVQRDLDDAAFAGTEFGEQRFFKRLLAGLNKLKPLDWPDGFVCRKATKEEGKSIDAAFGLFRERRVVGRIWAIYYETSRGATAAETFTSQGRVRLAIARVQRRSRCRKR